jgi:hypothetical protein
MARLEDCALERALAGEERLIVRGGEVVATWRRYDTALLMFLLRQRRTERFGSGSALPGPGDPLYERMKAMWQEEEALTVQEVQASLDAKLAELRERVLERRRLEGLCADFGEDGGPLRCD